MAVKIDLNKICVYLAVIFVFANAESGKFFIESEKIVRNPCDYDAGLCEMGICKHTERRGKKDYLCACPITSTGTKCEKKTPDCLTCILEKLHDCVGLLDQTGVCVCAEYTDANVEAPSICFFNKPRPEKQTTECDICVEGQQCVDYAQDDAGSVKVCQCPEGNTRGYSCAQDYRYDLPGDKYSCIETNMYGPLCMCAGVGWNRKGPPGFCKPKLIKYSLGGPLDVDSPCSLDNIRCRNGGCYVLEDNKYMCACPSKYTGKLCHYGAPHCDLCKKGKLKECLGFEDGSTTCVCSSFTDDLRYKSPGLCYYSDAKKGLQRLCQNAHVYGECTRGEDCVAYGEQQGSHTITCQCPVGKTRGKNCFEEYEYIDVESRIAECKHSTTQGPICLCTAYGKDKKAPGFCKTYLKAHGALDKPEGSGGPCDIKNSKCLTGKCMETEISEDSSFLCACSQLKTGVLCNQDITDCGQCQKDARRDCIKLHDDSIVCVCLELVDENLGKPPLICHLSATSNKTDCGESNTCDPEQECVSYQHNNESSDTLCTCSAGKKRGKNCEEEYIVDNPAEKFSCIDTKLYGPICLCDKYGEGIGKYGFCLPKLKESASFKVVQENGTTIIQTESPCAHGNDACKAGECVELEGSGSINFICSCPYYASGQLCTKDMPDCMDCRKEARKDCILLPNGYGVCVCVEFKEKGSIKGPAICVFQKLLKHNQLSCFLGGICTVLGRKCVNFSQVHMKGVVISCVCPAGKRRGKYCHEEYKITNYTEFPCVDSQVNGPICLCEEYGHGIEKYGFCKPSIKTQTVEHSIVKRSEKKRSLWEKIAELQAEQGKIDKERERERGKKEEQHAVAIGRSPFDAQDPYKKQFSKRTVGSLEDRYTEQESVAEEEREKGEREEQHANTIDRSSLESLRERLAELQAEQEKIDKERERERGKKEEQHAVAIGRSPFDLCVEGSCNEGFCKRFKSGAHMCVCPAGKTGLSCESDPAQESIAEKEEVERLAEIEKLKELLAKEEKIVEEKKEERTDTCYTGSCNGGSCTKFDTGYRCVCPEGKIGRSCQINIGTSSDGEPFNGGEKLEKMYAEQSDLCASDPCLHDGICINFSTSPADDFLCVCALGRKGKTCDEMIPDCDKTDSRIMSDCVSTPEGAICTCMIDYKEQMCQILMKKVTEWEIMRVMVTNVVDYIEVAALILLVVVGLTVCYLIYHCVLVSSKRRDFNLRYQRVIKRGEVPSAPLPDWLDISNDVAKQMFCCRTSTLPKSFKPVKRSKGKIRNKIKYKDKKDKKKTGRGGRNINENSPTIRRIIGFNNSQNKTMSLFSSLHNLKDHCGKTSKTNVQEKLKLRQQIVKDYIKKHRKYFERLKKTSRKKNDLQ